MKIGIIFARPFDILSVFQGPIGGSESAVSYLAIELVRLGCDVSLFTLSENPAHAFGVKCFKFEVKGTELNFDQEFISQEFDVVIIKNQYPELGQFIKKMKSNQIVTIFWTGHANDQIYLKPLSQQVVANGLDKVVAVSKWHISNLLEKFPNLKPKITYIQNAIGPSFQNLYHSFEEMCFYKKNNLSMAYTSTPFRGLEVLLDMSQYLEMECDIHIYSSMQVYGYSENNDR